MLSIRRIEGFISLIRPFTLLAPIIVSICIMIASYTTSNNSLDGLLGVLPTIILASVSLALLNAASNALNQVTDVESDKISKPYRPIPMGKITIMEATVVSIILYLFSISIAWFINKVFFLITLLIVVFTITYSLPPRFKKTLFLNQLWVALPRGFLGIIVSWSVFGDPLGFLPLTAATIAFFFLLGGSVTKDVKDCYADILTGSRTLINTYGVEKSSFMVFPFLFTPFLFILILIDMGLLDTLYWPLSLLVIPGFLVFYLMFLNKNNIGSRFENTPAWCLMYITYFLFAFGFSMISIMKVV